MLQPRQTIQKLESIMIEFVIAVWSDQKWCYYKDVEDFIELKKIIEEGN